MKKAKRQANPHVAGKLTENPPPATKNGFNNIGNDGKQNRRKKSAPLANQDIRCKWSKKDWLRGVDLNHRPLGYEPNELPGCSTPHFENNRTLICGQMAWCASSIASDAVGLHATAVEDRTQAVFPRARQRVPKSGL